MADLLKVSSQKNLLVYVFGALVQILAISFILNDLIILPEGEAGVGAMLAKYALWRLQLFVYPATVTLEDWIRKG